MRFLRAFLPFVWALPLAACSPAAPPGGPAGPAPGCPGAAPDGETAEIELVESAPTETALGHADVRDAAEVWPEMIARARRTLDVAQFYASDAPGPAAAAASRLGPVVAAIEGAVARGVRVRFLADASFAPKYPETLERLRRAGAAVQTIDVARRSGGVQHAKYFVVDGVEAFLGSQNFDWRALEHIQEMGVRVRSAAFAASLLAVFEDDWRWALGPAAGAPPGPTAAGATPPPPPPPPGPARRLVARTGETLTFVASPKGSLPDERAWDLLALEGLLAGATRSVDLQLLTYSVKNRDGSDFFALDDALRRAAARGVKVRLLASHWANRAGGEARCSLEALARAPNVEVRIVTVPPWSGGDVPFARVAHAKYLVVDGERAWVGTSNWEGDYFLRSRNVGVVASGGALARRLGGVFEGGWSGPLARPLGAQP